MSELIQVLTDNKIRSSANPSYRFVVNVAGSPIGAFTECTLPTLEFDIKEVKEGGVNTYTHCLPGRVKKSRIVLKNGIGLGAVLIPWFNSSLRGKVERKRVTVVLQNVKGETIMTWVAEQCLPVKWTAPQLKSDAKAIAVQTLEMVCGEVSCEHTPSQSKTEKWNPPVHIPKPAPNKLASKRGGPASNRFNKGEFSALFGPIKL